MEQLDQLLAQSQESLQSLLIISLLVSIGCAALCGWIAAHRNARWVYWSVMGFAFGPFALPFVFLAKPKSANKP
jgi:hypothetical protein